MPSLWIERTFESVLSEPARQLRGGKGGTVDIQFGELKSRYIEIESVKPDGPNQKGYSMSIAELEVFGKPQ